VNVSAVIDGAHYEDIYYGGGNGTLTVEHDTLLNPNGQTATVFPGRDFGPINGLVIDGNLLAGGGYVMYGGADTATGVSITNNRIARCLSAPVYDASSGGSDCANGPDGHGYFPYGGYFGVGAYLNNPTWTGNYWDDDLGSVGLPRG
jgi:hypothetical protein